jgi:hypothetical protein
MTRVAHTECHGRQRCKHIPSGLSATVDRRLVVLFSERI